MESATYVLARYSSDAYAEPVSDVTLGGNIRRLRIAAGFKTQGALAKALGVPQPQVSDWENDRYEMLDTKTLMRLGKELKVSMDLIIEGLDVGYDLVWQGSTGHSSPHLKGDAVDPASASRIAELESQVTTYKAIVAKLRSLSTDALALLGDRDEGGTAARAQSKRRRNH